MRQNVQRFSGEQVSGQNEWYLPELKQTAAMRHIGRGVETEFSVRNEGSARQTLEKLEGGAGQDAEHEVAHDFGRATDADKEGAKVVFELGVDALDGTALLEAARGGRIHGDFFGSSRIEINDGDMSKLAGEGMDFFGVVSGVHEVVTNVDKFSGLLSQGDGHLGVMKRGGSQDGADGDVPVSHVQMEFVTDPGFGEALGVALAAVVAARGQVGQVLDQGTLRLKLQPSELFGFKRLIFGGTTSLLGDFRRRHGFGGRLFAGGDGGGITADVSHQGVPQVFLDHGGVDFFRQMGLGESGKGAGEGGFGGDLADSFPATESAQGRTVLEVVQEGASGGEIPDIFGDESFGDGESVLRFGANEFPSEGGHETFDPGEFDDCNKTSLLSGKFSDFFFQHGEELALEDESSGGEAHKKSSDGCLTLIDLSSKHELFTVRTNENRLC